VAVLPVALLYFTECLIAPLCQSGDLIKHSKRLRIGFIVIFHPVPTVPEQKLNFVLKSQFVDNPIAQCPPAAKEILRCDSKSRSIFFAAAAGLPGCAPHQKTLARDIVNIKVDPVTLNMELRLIRIYQNPLVCLNIPILGDYMSCIKVFAIEAEVIGKPDPNVRRNPLMVS
jgi:hypothetical protein